MVINLLPHYYRRREVLLCWHLSARLINDLSVRPTYVCPRNQRSLQKNPYTIHESEIYLPAKIFRSPCSRSTVASLLSIINYS